MQGESPSLNIFFGVFFSSTPGVEEINAAHVEASERSFREWAWFYAEGIAKLDTKFVWLSYSACELF
jgi:hypothetical protein